MTPPPDCASEFTAAAFAPATVPGPLHASDSSRDSVGLSRDLTGTAAAIAADVSRLVRPRIALMVLATVVASMWLTAGRGVGGPALFWLLVGTTLVAASSSIANQILERDADRLMPRTVRSRPGG